MSKKLTYWKLIESNRIEIPVIQREYAQGRDEDRIEALRKAFVADILHSIDENDEPLHLGFIYGKVEGKDKYQDRLRNKRAIENILNAVEGYAQHLDMRIETKIDSDIDVKSDNSNLPIFIPLDGQQRLTTLFLVHWYLSLYCEQDASNISKILSHFTYKTRKSSFEFCRAITDESTRFDIERIGNDTLSEFIQKRKWFRKNWLKDSTVKGMLTMLDEIQLQFNSVDDKSKLFNVLIKEEAPIQFDFLDLDELNQTDELYVKMNARGKQLSEFEHFKAWLIHHVKEQNIQIDIEDWKTKLDKEWLDLFWRNKGSNYTIDSTIYNFIKQIALFAYIHDPVGEFSLSFTSTVRESEFIPFSKYEQFNFFNSGTLNFVFNTLNHLCNEELMNEYKGWLSEIACYPFLSKEDELHDVFIKNSKPVDRPLSVFYYALILYANIAQNKREEERFKTWIRMSRNLVYNTYIQNPENYVDAIRGLYDLQPKMTVVLDESTDELKMKPTSIKFFGDKIFRNEIYKINLTNSDDKWKELIYKYENQEYFRGDIRLILSYAFVSFNEYDLNLFEFYGDRLCKLFGDNIRGHKDFLLQRALITKGNYMPRVSSNFLVCLSNSETLRARRDNWQKAFNEESSREIIKQLIDENLQDVNTIEQELINTINNYNLDDWRKYLIKSPKPIGFCTKGFIRMTGIASATTQPDIYLLRTSKLYGRHVELRSYFHFTEKIENKDDLTPFTSSFYWENRMGKYAFPCIRIKGWKYRNVNYKLEVTYSDKDKFLIQFLSEENHEVINKNLVDCLESNNWVIQEDSTKCHILLRTDDEFKSALDTALVALKNIT